MQSTCECPTQPIDYRNSQPIDSELPLLACGLMCWDSSERWLLESRSCTHGQSALISPWQALASRSSSGCPLRNCPRLSIDALLLITRWNYGSSTLGFVLLGSGFIIAGVQVCEQASVAFPTHAFSHSAVTVPCFFWTFGVQVTSHLSHLSSPFRGFWSDFRNGCYLHRAAGQRSRRRTSSAPRWRAA